MKKYLKFLALILFLIAIVFLIISNNKKVNSVAAISEDIGGKTFVLEIASDEKSRELGLGQRNSLPENQGMLFAFSKSSLYAFWMKDTHFPLDILWLDDNCVVVGKATMYPESFPKAFYPDKPAKYAIELPLDSVKNIIENQVLSCEAIRTIQSS